jgi:hypothetical protein
MCHRNFLPELSDEGFQRGDDSFSEKPANHADEKRASPADADIYFLPDIYAFVNVKKKQRADRSY